MELVPDGDQIFNGRITCLILQFTVSAGWRVDTCLWAVRAAIWQAATSFKSIYIDLKHGRKSTNVRAFESARGLVIK